MITILVVEDDAVILDTIRKTLTNLGCPVRILTAGAGRQALDTALREPVDVFIIDLLLPDWDGLALSTELRKTYRHAPIIIESSITDFEYQAKTHDQIENLAFLAKPYTPEKLAEKVKSAMALAKATGSKKLILRKSGVSWVFSVENVIYIERIKNKKWIRVAAYDYENDCVEEVDFFGVTLKEVQAQLTDEDKLCMCHKSYLVNAKKIKRIDARTKLIYLLHTDRVILYSEKYRENLIGEGDGHGVDR